MSASQSSIKLPYLCCLRPHHEGESLNMVCIHKQCPQRGLICSLCREEHNTHRVIPLKFLLKNLKNRLDDTLEGQYCDKLEELENLKNGLLYDLKLCVENLAEQFQKFEQTIIDDFNAIKLEIIDQIQLGLQLQDLVASAVAGPTNPSQYISDFSKLARWVQHKQNNELELKLDFEAVLLPYRSNELRLMAKLKRVQEYVEQELWSKSPEQIVIKEVKEVKKPIVASSIKYRFNDSYKGASIVLNQNKTLARQSSTVATRFAIITEGMGLKQRRIVFKINTLKNWVGLGVCLRDRIVNAGYAFKYENLGHGSYLLSNNGYTWSHSDKEDNIHACLFLFKQDSIMQVILKPNQLEFHLRDTNASHKLKIDFKEEEWPNVCFCVNLCSADDAVEIIDE